MVEAKGPKNGRRVMEAEVRRRAGVRRRAEREKLGPEARDPWGETMQAHSAR